MDHLNIIIVNWNTGELLKRCLASLHALPEAERQWVNEVVVVDNASIPAPTPGESASPTLAGERARIKYIQLEKNVGFAAANNTAWRQFSDNNHVLLLNPDTEVKPGALAAMIQVLEEKPDVGVVGPKLVNPNGSLQGSVRPFPQFLDFIFYMLKLGRIVQARQEAAYDYSKAGYADQVMGAAFLIRSRLREEVGLLDEGYFTLFEEVDYCKRALAKGWRTYFTPAGEVMHVRAASFRQLVGFRKTLPWMASSLHYARKHLGVLPWLLLWFLVPISLLLTIPASLKHLWLWQT